MANNEVLLLEAINGLGSEGDTVTVKAGYARNFLFPQKRAIPVNQGNRKQIDALQLAKDKRISEEAEAAKTLAEKISQLNLSISVKAGDNGKMFGSVTSSEILNLITEQGMVLEKKQLNVAQPIKELGTHTIEVRINSEVSVEFKLDIVSENPISNQDNLNAEANEEEGSQ